MEPRIISTMEVKLRIISPLNFPLSPNLKNLPFSSDYCFINGMASLVPGFQNPNNQTKKFINYLLQSQTTE